MSKKEIRIVITLEKDRDVRQVFNKTVYKEDRICIM
jgi:hypothetical protein